MVLGKVIKHLGDFEEKLIDSNTKALEDIKNKASFALKVATTYLNTLQQNRKSDPNKEKILKDYKYKVSAATDLESKNNKLKSAFSKLYSVLISDGTKLLSAMGY